jgi:hypothetical protein
MIAARSLLHGERSAGTKKSRSASDAENAFTFYILLVCFYQLSAGSLYASQLLIRDVVSESTIRLGERPMN